jgi:hypothetical protein
MFIARKVMVLIIRSGVNNTSWGKTKLPNPKNRNEWNTWVEDFVDSYPMNRLIMHKRNANGTKLLHSNACRKKKIDVRNQ